MYQRTGTDRDTGLRRLTLPCAELRPHRLLRCDLAVVRRTTERPPHPRTSILLLRATPSPHPVPTSAIRRRLDPPSADAGEENSNLQVHCCVEQGMMESMTSIAPSVGSTTTMGLEDDANNFSMSK
ncbi:uncharacterized protein [Triticum aestivum]|uniref:uncharacterized protein n=1 Tax=Triticum aestivum TaxID=4565 RepID=UPI001D034A89|nr:uncharacterized protein LOC123171163 [Triticum aestivum]